MVRVKFFLCLLVIGLIPPSLCHATPPHTGVEGTAFYFGPRDRVHPPPKYPLSATFTIVSLDKDKVVGQVTCDAQGYFKVSLKHGMYLFRPESFALGDGLHLVSLPIVVTVEKKSFTSVTFEYRFG